MQGERGTHHIGHTGEGIGRGRADPTVPHFTTSHWTETLEGLQLSIFAKLDRRITQ